jgi:RHS repeat-associated protein
MPTTIPRSVLTKSIDAIGDVVAETEYDAIDRAVKSTDTFGKITTIDYDDQLRKKTTVDPHGVVTVEIRDAVGNIKDVYQANRHTHYDFDDLNRKTQVIDAEGGVTKYKYFKDGQTKSMTDAAGNVTSYGYDGGGRMTTETNFFGTRRYGYDDVNNRTDMLDRNGRVIHYSLDNLNRVVAEDWLSLLPAAILKKFTYGYDANGNVKFADDGNIRYEYSYEERDLVERVDQFRSGQVPVSFVYKYDDVENLTETQELVGGSLKAITRYQYEDPRYYNTQVTQFGVGLSNKRVDFVYDPEDGLLTEVDRYLNNQLIVKTTNAYDDFGRLTGITHQNGTGIISTHGYDYDALNRLTAESRDGVSRQFGYDNIDQVKSVSGSNSESYDYDKNGNRTNAGYEHVAQNRLTSDGIYSYDYDDEGNRTKRTEIATGKVDEYTWDYRNRLVSVVSKDKFGAVLQAVAYEYDVNDLRVKKTVNGVVENYYLDGDNIAFVTDGVGNETFHYMYGLEADQVLAQDSSTGMVWSLAGRLGSIDVLIDGSGAIVDQRTYDSFGNTLSQLDPNVKFRFGYTGRESDPETGLYYYRARYFDPNVGRFISTDPIGFEAGDANLYRYVNNSSTLATDPTGKWINFAVGAAIGFGVELGIQLFITKKFDPAALAISTISGAVSSGVGAFISKGVTSLATQVALNAGIGFNIAYWGKVAQNGLEGKGLSVDGAWESGAIGALGGAGGALAERGIAKYLAKKQSTDFLKQIQRTSESFERLGAPSPYKGHEPQISLGLNEQSKLVNFVSDLELSKGIKSPSYHTWAGWTNNIETMGDQIKNRMYGANKINFNLESFDLSNQMSRMMARNKAILEVPGNRMKKITDLFPKDVDLETISRWELNTIISDVNLIDKTKFYDSAAKTISRDEVWARLHALVST